MKYLFCLVVLLIIATTQAQTHTLTDTAVIAKLDICKESYGPVMKYAGPGKVSIVIKYSDEYLTIILYDYNGRGTIIRQNAVVFTRANEGWTTAAPMRPEEFTIIENEIKKRL